MKSMINTLKKVFGPGILELLVNGGIALGLIIGALSGYSIYEKDGVAVGIIIGFVTGGSITSLCLFFAHKLDSYWGRIDTNWDNDKPKTEKVK